MNAPRRHVALVLGALACTYEAPDDPAGETVLNEVRGTVLASGPEALTASGAAPVILFVAAADDPMPPFGTGRPVTFATVPGAAFTADDDVGVAGAPFAIPGLPDGDWLLTGLLDRDVDFHPSVPVLAGATCGDLVGAHVESLAEPVPGVIRLGGGELVDGVAVLLGTVAPFERPAFTLDDAVVTVGDPAGAGFGLAAVGIEATVGPFSLSLEGPLDPLDPAPCATALWRHFIDADQDGAVDLRDDLPPELGVLDVWPRIYLEHLGAVVEEGGVRRFEAPDGRYVAEALPYTPCGPGCTPPEAAVVGQPFPATGLTAFFGGVVQRTDAAGTTVVSDPAAIPRGAWRVTVVLETGQTWSVPNELDPSVRTVTLPPPGLVSEGIPSQGAWLTFE